MICALIGRMDRILNQTECWKFTRWSPHKTYPSLSRFRKMLARGDCTGVFDEIGICTCVWCDGCDCWDCWTGTWFWLLAVCTCCIVIIWCVTPELFWLLSTINWGLKRTAWIWLFGWPLDSGGPVNVTKLLAWKRTSTLKWDSTLQLGDISIGRRNDSKGTSLRCIWHRCYQTGRWVCWCWCFD